jgi:hypothetical protein
MIWNLIGWASTGILLLSYVLLTTGKLDAKRPAYHVLALVSGAGLLALNLHAQVPQGVVVNGFWLLVALGALLGMALKARAARRSFGGGDVIVLEGSLLRSLIASPDPDTEPAPKPSVPPSVTQLAASAP